MTLPIATEGPCKGHACDNCRICQSGRCCRNDNPDYKLPELGEWDGPIYGELGVLADDGEKAECHCCGEFFGHLGSHVLQAHNLMADEYKAIFGLNKTTGLIGPALKQKRIASVMSRPEQVKRLQEAGQKVWSEWTPEQRSDMSSKQRKNARLENRKGTSAHFKAWFAEHDSPNAKLTDDQVREIRSASPVTVAERSVFADKFGVSDKTVRMIVRGQRRTFDDDPDPVLRAAHSKITEDQVRRIRELNPVGTVAQRELGREMGVHESTIFDILKRRHWKWVDSDNAEAAT